jgi:hypothetical protein
MISKMKEKRTPNCGVKRLNRIKKQLDVDVFNFEDFVRESPFSLEQLKSINRYHELSTWRNVGILWLLMDGYSFKDVGRFFNRHHATIIHTTVEVDKCLEGFGNRDLLEAIQHMVKHSTNVPKKTPTMDEITDFVKKYHPLSPRLNKMAEKIHFILNNEKL